MVGVEEKLDLFGATLWIAGLACRFLLVLSEVTSLFDLERTLGSIIIACNTKLIISLIFNLEVNILIYLVVSRLSDCIKQEN